MTTGTDSVRAGVKVRSHAVVLHAIHDLLHDLAMREFTGFILVGQDADLDGLGNLGHLDFRVALDAGVHEHRRSVAAGVLVIDQLSSGRDVDMAFDATGICVLTGSTHERVASGAFRLGLRLGMTPHATGLRGHAVHGLLGGYEAALFLAQ